MLEITCGGDDDLKGAALGFDMHIKRGSADREKQGASETLAALPNPARQTFTN